MLQVTESTDFEYFAELLPFTKEQLVISAKLCRFFLVTLGSRKCGGFVVIDKSPFPPELHTELNIKGKLALKSFLILRDLLKANGCRKITTYAPNDKREIRLAACIAGFVKTGQDDKNTFYELSV